MKRAVLIAVGILGLTLLAASLTELTLALGHGGSLSDDLKVRPQATPSPSTTPTPPPTTTPSPSPLPTATPTSIPTPAVPTAVTNSFVHLRAGASTATPILADLNGGTVVTLGSYSDSQWQQVQYNGLNGYVYKSYLTY
ncbi:MAG TPA: SH3 domain-containing protein [Candidatus Saccharimonadia bacterium]|nr:SH3 domain-containing protein [Candidatus Saccharimonadia bacterium]